MLISAHFTCCEKKLCGSNEVFQAATGPTGSPNITETNTLQWSSDPGQWLASAERGGWNFKHPSCHLYAKQSRGPVRGNHKVLDGWKQLKGFCISAVWLISCTHMSSPTAGLLQHREPPMLPSGHSRRPKTPANIISASVSLTVVNSGWTRLGSWYGFQREYAYCKLSRATLQGWAKVAAVHTNKEELIRDWADKQGGEWCELAVQQGDISAIPAVFSWLRDSSLTHYSALTSACHLPPSVLPQGLC